MFQTKRFLDILFAILAIIVLSPLWILTAVVIRAGIHGSVLFRQKRIGYLGKPFRILKFRTMHKDIEDGDLIPGIGKAIRRVKLDELPQLVNIVRGEMSFVGPRPYIEQESKDLPAERFSMRPGMTGLAQVCGNTALSWEERTAYDLEYVHNFSLLLDMEILFRTVKVVLFGEKSCLRHHEEYH